MLGLGRYRWLALGRLGRLGGLGRGRRLVPLWQVAPQALVDGIPLLVQGDSSIHVVDGRRRASRPRLEGQHHGPEPADEPADDRREAGKPAARARPTPTQASRRRLRLRSGRAVSAGAAVGASAGLLGATGRGAVGAARHQRVLRCDTPTPRIESLSTRGATRMIDGPELRTRSALTRASTKASGPSYGARARAKIEPRFSETMRRGRPLLRSMAPLSSTYSRTASWKA